MSPITELIPFITMGVVAATIVSIWAVASGVTGVIKCWFKGHKYRAERIVEYTDNDEPIFKGYTKEKWCIRCGEQQKEGEE